MHGSVLLVFVVRMDCRFPVRQSEVVRAAYYVDPDNGRRRMSLPSMFDALIAYASHEIGGLPCKFHDAVLEAFDRSMAG